MTAEANGSMYTLTLDGTTWSAAYKAPEAMSLALGTTGGDLSIERLEDGSYQANGSALANGTVITAENGNQYTVSISDDGNFSADYVVAAGAEHPAGDVRLDGRRDQGRERHVLDQRRDHHGRDARDGRERQRLSRASIAGGDFPSAWTMSPPCRM